ncbi:hypothetical protein KP509_16G032600 [Ceratopteris richardii]|uniref:DNA 5'-3' helicase FANCJ n=1 Tax=Ceratopteris richardii TaxID=49495 RepID=A0A8T2SXS3_CERRI|nr:hypothetical protein KP509_16G032600 [Ceratopteris richardii]
MAKPDGGLCRMQRSYRIGGINVEFPYKAYSSQLAFMGKVVATLEKAHRRCPTTSSSNGLGCHALLESPTGTGKSLALLCSTLAWLQHLKSSGSRSRASPSSYASPIEHANAVSKNFLESQPPETLSSLTTADMGSESGTGVSREQIALGGGFLPEPFTTGDGIGFNPEGFSTEAGGGFLPGDTAGDGPSEGNRHSSKKRKYPVIFYATRTHSQITQVIREYRKTSYRVHMAVLAARKHYCTNKQVCKKKNIDEECKLLLKDSERSCFQFRNVHKVKQHSSLQKGGAYEIHDIEDLVGIANSVRGCAYFAARALALDAEIVFCPYGYLLNPVIRDAMEIDLNGAIVILDEAHNIEDVAREAGSIDLETSSLEALRMELEQLCALGATDFYHPLLDMVHEMLSWIYQKCDSLQQQDFEHYSCCWLGEDALSEFEQAGISSQGFEFLSQCVKKAVGAAAESETDQSHLSGFSVGILEGLFSVLSFMLKENAKHLHDFRLVVQKFVKRDAELGVTGWVSSISIWCLNPAVVFEELVSKAMSVILTSGTLSPLGSFASELGVNFEVSMEAPHVIDMKTQVWAGSIPKGLNSVPLNASYKNADAYAFQDALGKTLEELFKVTPDGALVFFPSYKLLDKLCNRWKATNQWNRLYELKQLFIEPRGQMEGFETILAEYYRAISGKPKSSSEKPKPRGGGKRILKDEPIKVSVKRQPKNGAAFLAVCRGKVSEGIDFSDKNARIVIVVGIPFPNQKDMQVVMKKQYNNQNKNLLSGDKWYCYQAFRALNQAVGRCIRHRDDYGAIILLDERYKRSSYVDYMSKWLRNSIRHVDTLEESVKELRSFFAKLEPLSSHNMISNDGAKIISSSSQKVLRYGIVSGKQSQTRFSTKDKENIDWLGTQVAATVISKTRSLKGKQPDGVAHVIEEERARERLSLTQSKIIQKKPTKAGCEQTCVHKRDHHLQEIQNETAVFVNIKPALSDSEITVTESAEVAAMCSSLVCSHAVVREDSPAVGCAEEHQTPISVASNILDMHATGVLNKSINSHGNSMPGKYTMVTPCNLFKEDSSDPTSKGPGNMCVADSFVNVSTTPLCSKSVDLDNKSSCKLIKSEGQYADGQVMNMIEIPTSERQDLSIEYDNVRNVLDPSQAPYTPNSKGQTCISCLHCKTILVSGLEDSAWQRLTMKKKYLSGLAASDGTHQMSEHCEVTLLDVPLEHPLRSSSLIQTSRNIWVEEDGCVFEPLYCSKCGFKLCIGAHVLAGDRANIELVDMFLLLSSAVKLSHVDVETSQCFEVSPTEGICREEFSTRSNKRVYETQTLARPKLKLPRRE